MHFAVGGLLEQHLDEKLMEEEMRKANEVIDCLGLEVTSPSDTELGFFLGNAFAQMKSVYTSLYSREPTQEETQEFIAIVKRRVSEIQNKTSAPFETNLITVHEISPETPETTETPETPLSDEKFSFSSNGEPPKASKKEAVTVAIGEAGDVQENVTPIAEITDQKTEKKKKKKSKSWI